MHFYLPLPIGFFVFLKEILIDVVLLEEVLLFDVFVAPNDELGFEGVHGRGFLLFVFSMGVWNSGQIVLKFIDRLICGSDFPDGGVKEVLSFLQN